MIWTIAEREILDNLMSLRFLFGTVLCLSLVVISNLAALFLWNVFLFVAAHYVFVKRDLR